MHMLQLLAIYVHSIIKCAYNFFAFQYPFQHHIMGYSFENFAKLLYTQTAKCFECGLNLTVIW